jgi:hypothetical protein
MSLKDLGKKLKETFVEEDGGQGQAPAAPKPAAAPPTFRFTPGATPMGPGFGTAAAPAPAGSPFAVPGTAVLDEKIYKSVLKKTDFDDTPVGKTLHSYYDGLEDMDPNTRFKTAFKLAAKRDGITAAQVLAAFDQLQSALDAETRNFQGLAASIEQKEIVARQQRIADLTNQRQQIDQQIAQLQGELADQTASHSNATQQFTLAAQRRATEISQQRAQFASLLQ